MARVVEHQAWALSLRLRPAHGSPWRDPHFSDCIEELLAKPVNGINAPQRPDCVAEVVGLELRNVVAKYLFETSHRFAGMQPNSDLGDYSRLSCGAEETPDHRHRRCCARAASGHATAPPSSVMNSRRLNWSNCIRS